MAQRSEDGIGITSVWSKRLKRAKAVWTRSAISIQASSTKRLRQQAGHTEAPEPERKKISQHPLESDGASTHGLAAPRDSVPKAA